jgi:hypothetical protein
MKPILCAGWSARVMQRAFKSPIAAPFRASLSSQGLVSPAEIGH